MVNSLCRYSAMLLSILIGIIIVIVIFGLVICAIEREWGTLIFALVMIAAMVGIVWYDVAHSAVG